MFSKRAINARGQDILHEEVEALCENFEAMRKTGEVRDIREVFLGYTSVAAARYFAAKRLDYQEDRELISDWYATTQTIPQVTLIVKQFPWVIGYGMLLPRWVIALISVRLAKLLDTHEVSDPRRSACIALLTIRPVCARPSARVRGGQDGSSHWRL